MTPERPEWDTRDQTNGSIADIDLVASNDQFVRETTIRNHSTEWPQLNQRSLHITPIQRRSQFVTAVQSNPWLRKFSVLKPV